MALSLPIGSDLPRPYFESLTFSVVAPLVLPAASVAVTVNVSATCAFGLPGVAATVTVYAPEEFAVVGYVAVGAGDVFVTVIEAFASAEPETTSATPLLLS